MVTSIWKPSSDRNRFYATVIRIRAERRLGELLIEQKQTVAAIPSA